MIESSHSHHGIGIFFQSIMICDLLSGVYPFMTTSHYPRIVVDTEGILLCLQHTAFATVTSLNFANFSLLESDS
jgi:hypothetical protein